MSETINIKDMDKTIVLAALYNASKPQGMGFMHYDSTPMTKEEASELLDQATYFDYLKGRVMKIDLSGDELNTWGYDRDNGEGAAEKAINAAIADMNVNNAEIQETHKKSTLESAEDLEGKMESDKSYVSGSTFHLGFNDQAEHLKPKIDAAREANEEA